MNTGTTISGIGHAILILWLLFGGLFSARDETAVPAVTEVSLITGAEFAALSAPSIAPTPQVDAPADGAPADPVTEPQPEVTPPDPVVTPAPEVPVEPQPAPDPVPEVQPDPQPVPEPTPTPDPQPLVEPVPEPVAEPQPVTDPGLQTSPLPRQRPVPRVAPVAAEAPPPDAAVADTTQAAVTLDAPADAPVVDPPAEATAPAEAATAIVPETADPVPEVATSAPRTSARPTARPAKPTAAAAATAVVEAPADQQSQTDAQASAIAAALADAQSGTSNDGGSDVTTTPQAPSGPPLTAGEKDGLRVAVQSCWNVAALSSEAMAVSVTIAVSMTQDGKPDRASIRMIGFDGGTEAAASKAYEAARRAIIICGDKGFPLPPEKYEQWKNVEMVFDPKGMRLK